MAALAHEGEEIIRHDAHIPEGDPHYQPRRLEGGHVGYDIGVFVAGLLPVVGWFADADETRADASPLVDARAQNLYGADYYDLTPEHRDAVMKSMAQNARQDEKKPDEDPNKNKDSWCRECPGEILGIPVQ